MNNDTNALFWTYFLLGERVEQIAMAIQFSVYVYMYVHEMGRGK